MLCIQLCFIARSRFSVTWIIRDGAHHFHSAKRPVDDDEEEEERMKACVKERTVLSNRPSVCVPYLHERKKEPSVIYR